MDVFLECLVMFFFGVMLFVLFVEVVYLKWIDDVC